MNREQLRHEVEERAVAICLVFSAVMFLIGAALQRVDRALTLGGPRG